MLVAQVAGLFLLVVTVNAVDIAQQIFDESPKCMPPIEGIPIFLRCFEKVHGAPFDHKSTQIKDISKENKLDIMMCISKIFGLISEDEKTIDIDIALIGIEMTDTTDEIKTAWKKDLRSCAEKNAGNGRDFIECAHAVFEKNCK